MNRTLKFSGSVLCMDPLNIGQSVELSKDVIDYWHLDLLDGTQRYKRLGCYPEQMAAIKRISDKPFEVHAMVQDIEAYIQQLQAIGADIVSFHIENNTQIIRNCEKIKKAGMRPAIVCNLQTPIEQIYAILDYNLVDMVELMSINPGMVGSEVYLPVVEKKAQKIREYIKENNLKDVMIGIDGGVRFNTVEELYAAGIDYQVCGSILYSLKGNEDLSSKVQQLSQIKNSINNER